MGTPFENLDPVTKRFVSTGQFSYLMFQGKVSNVTTVTGITGSGIEFSGAKYSFVNHYFSEGAILFDRSRSLSAWFKTCAAGNLPILMGGNGPNNGITMALQKGWYEIKGPGKILKSKGFGALNNNQWHQVTATWAGKSTSFVDILLYIDGKKVEKENLTSSTKNWNGPRVTVAIGAEWTWWTDSVSATFKGTIDEA